MTLNSAEKKVRDGTQDHVKLLAHFTFTIQVMHELVAEKAQERVNLQILLVWMYFFFVELCES